MTKWVAPFSTINDKWSIISSNNSQSNIFYYLISYLIRNSQWNKKIFLNIPKEDSPIWHHKSTFHNWVLTEWPFWLNLCTSVMAAYPCIPIPFLLAIYIFTYIFSIKNIFVSIWIYRFWLWNRQTRWQSIKKRFDWLITLSEHMYWW